VTHCYLSYRVSWRQTAEYFFTLWCNLVAFCIQSKLSEIIKTPLACTINMLRSKIYASICSVPYNWISLVFIVCQVLVWQPGTAL
jgi:hypothetical protein